MRGSLASVSAEVGVSTGVVDAFGSLIEKVVIQKIRIGVVVKISSLLLIISHENNRFDITNVVKNKVFFRVTIARREGPAIHNMLIISFDCLNIQSIQTNYQLVLTFLSVDLINSDLN